MSLSKTLYPLLSTGSTQEDPSQHNWKIVDWDVKNQNKQTVDEQCDKTDHCYDWKFVKSDDNNKTTLTAV